MQVSPASLHLRDAVQTLFDFLQPHCEDLQQLVQVQLTNSSHALGTEGNDISSGMKITSMNVSLYLL